MQTYEINNFLNNSWVWFTGRHGDRPLHLTPAFILVQYDSLAGVAELVDVVDSKSTDSDIVRVRVSPPAPLSIQTNPAVIYRIYNRTLIQLLRMLRR